MKRFVGIDLYRLIFAFLVVIIHVPLYGRFFIDPIYRSAVPFFYVISGYFAYSGIDTESRLMKASKKWFILWAMYFTLLTICSIIAHILVRQSMEFTPINILQIVLGGDPKGSIDYVTIYDIRCGVYVTWFLLSGSYAFAILSFISKYKCLNFRSTYIVTLVVYAVCILAPLASPNIEVLKVFKLSLPYLVLGIFIRKHEDLFKESIKGVMPLFALLLVYVEWIFWHFMHVQSECYITTPIFICCLYVALLKWEPKLQIYNKLAQIGRNNAIYIYIYHRFVFFVIFLLCGKEILPIAAILVFLVSTLFSMAYLKLTHRKLKKINVKH